MKIEIPVTEEWNFMFQPTSHYSYTRRPFQEAKGRADFVTYSEPYSEEYGEPIWFYSWGNARWLRCPIGRPGDLLNDAGDRIARVDVCKIRGTWMFVVSIHETTERSKGT